VVAKGSRVYLVVVVAAVAESKMGGVAATPESKVGGVAATPESKLGGVMDL
jgi:hypothetical protein